MDQQGQTSNAERRTPNVELSDNLRTRLTHTAQHWLEQAKIRRQHAESYGARNSRPKDLAAADSQAAAARELAALLASLPSHG
jgi:predicted XRE-type DNA-binding protein